MREDAVFHFFVYIPVILIFILADLHTFQKIHLYLNDKQYREIKPFHKFLSYE